MCQCFFPSQLIRIIRLTFLFTQTPNICFWIKLHILYFLQEQVFKIPLADVRSMRTMKPKKTGKPPSVDIYYGHPSRTKLITISLKQVTAPFTACQDSVVLEVKVLEKKVFHLYPCTASSEFFKSTSVHRMPVHLILSNKTSFINHDQNSRTFCHYIICGNDSRENNIVSV